MTLDKENELLNDAIRATSEWMEIMPAFVEKDYWTSKILQNLSNSAYGNKIVFKGGTSLSKGYGLVSRFSEDIDLAVLAENLTGNQIKTLMSNVSKEITIGLNETVLDGVTSKGSRYRKMLFSYPTMFNKNKSENRAISEYVVLEINSFANPYPYERITMESFITSFMRYRGMTDMIEKYDMGTFELNILDRRRTLTEKLVSLMRCSMADDYIAKLSSKIRHFYDLHYLLHDSECHRYLESTNFNNDFSALLNDDYKRFDNPDGWQQKAVADSPLINNLHDVWGQLYRVYLRELAALAYKPIPSQNDIEQSMEEILSYIRNKCM
ncbi:MAG: nucleotidyl transferase AbiEii/AbiGii toxin family protein [Prevotellaceae bacterium]|nr:nucleotidyl transferase AbiEii/AbiGii toxin family protein [Prevotellaceae bacterium]